jgi:hypothetical protein
MSLIRRNSVSAASVGGLFHFKPSAQCRLLARGVVRGIAASRQLLQLLGAKLTGTLHLFDHLVGAQFIYPTGCSLP